jgi:hypothetical protein
VVCNVSVVDLDGTADITGVNATFFSSPNISSSPDDPNGHYTNTSCELLATIGNEKRFGCTHTLWYFAVNGTWTCNATATDSLNLTNSTALNTTVDPLYAANMSNTTIDFGNVQAGLLSSNVSINISNLGNQVINATVYGFGLVPGDGNSFNCLNMNISVNAIHFAANITANYTVKRNLSSSPQFIMQLRKQTSVGVLQQNTSYWQILVPVNVSDTGSCQGSVLVQADPS